MSFRFQCSQCDEIHEGMPTFGAPAPASYYDVPEDERAQRCTLTEDECVIDDEFFFVRGCLDIPVHGEAEPFSWGVWVSLSESSYLQWKEYFDQETRSHIGPFFGWFNTWLELYPDTFNLKTKAHLRDEGFRPLIELEPTDHPLAIEQRQGISVERVAEIYGRMMHRAGAQ